MQGEIWYVLCGQKPKLSRQRIDPEYIDPDTHSLGLKWVLVLNSKKSGTIALALFGRILPCEW